jgi:pilus assembly protein TadC
MSLFAEFFAAIAYALFEATVWLAMLAAKPLQFLFSASYRKEVRAGWAGSRGRQIFDLLGGTTVLALFTATVLWWTFAFLQRPSPEDRRWKAKLEKADPILQKAHDEMVARRRKSEDHK